MDTTHSEPQAIQKAESVKPIHTLLLDTSPILLNQPSISTLLANSHVLVTTASVLAEIRGEEARNRLETLYKPFLTVRAPKDESIKIVRDFARKTGDSSVLSATDLEVLALAYDLECERNGGDWRLRKTPGQKRLNGKPPTKTQSEAEPETNNDTSIEERLGAVSLEDVDPVEQQSESVPELQEDLSAGSDTAFAAQNDAPTTALNAASADSADPTSEAATDDESENTPVEIVEDGISDSDEGWITPSNIKRHQAKDEATSNTTKTETKTLQVATMTGDFAMQNVLLQMNLNLLSTKTCKRVAHIKQMILRCHGCFATTRDMSKQFCDRCGRPTLTRVTCTTNDRGEVKLHLKSNHQWNNRGNVFSIPKPVSGTASQKWKGPKQGGGQGGWGNGLILAEDQKEYVRAISSQKRTKQKDLMDEDLLPSILTGDRGRSGGRVKVGAGRTVNARKR